MSKPAKFDRGKKLSKEEYKKKVKEKQNLPTDLTRQKVNLKFIHHHMLQHG